MEMFCFFIEMEIYIYIFDDNLIVIGSVIIFKTQKFKFMPSFDSTQVYITGSVGVGKNRTNRTTSFRTRKENAEKFRF